MSALGFAMGLAMALSSQPSASSEEEAMIDAALIEARDKARLWHYSWTGLFSAGLAAQGVLFAVSEDDEDRYAFALGAVPPAVGLSLQWIQRLEALGVDEDVAPLADRDQATRIRLKRALLERYADSEGQQRNWFAHLGPLFLNTSVAGLIWWATDDPVRAAIQLGAGITVSELRVWTSPQAATHAVRSLGPSPARGSLHPFIGRRTVGLQWKF